MDKITFEFVPRPNHTNINGIRYDEEALKKAIDGFNKRIKDNNGIADMHYYPNACELSNIIGSHGELVFDKEKGCYTLEVKLRKDSAVASLINPKDYKMTVAMYTRDDLTENKTVKNCDAGGLLYPVSKRDIKIPTDERK